MKITQWDKYSILIAFILLTFTALMLLTNHQKIAFISSLSAYIMLVCGVILSIYKWKI